MISKAKNVRKIVKIVKIRLFSTLKRKHPQQMAPRHLAANYSTRVKLDRGQKLFVKKIVKLKGFSQFLLECKQTFTIVLKILKLRNLN